MNRIIWYFVILSLPLHGATFIGNGGNAGDYDLQVTIGMVYQTLDGLKGDTSNLCRCSERYPANGVCAALRALNEKQVEYCRVTLLKYKDAIVALAGPKSSVSYVWSDDNLVADENGKMRTADAVAQHKARKIILDRSRYLAMPQTFRIALITHELFHLTQVDGRYLKDHEIIGPFKEAGKLLDALGAATAIAANERGVIGDLHYLENVSRSHKNFVVQLEGKVIHHEKKKADALMKKRQSGGTMLGVEYKPYRIGYRLGLESVYNSATQESEIKVNERIHLLTLGASYYWFPVNAYLSRWNELTVSCAFDVLAGLAKYQVEDEALKLQDDAKVSGAQLGAQINVPIVFNFWVNAGYETRYVKYKYDDLNISNSELQHIVYIGGAYAL